MTRRQQNQPPEPRDMKQRILDASARLFAEKGFDGTSIRDIVEAANVGRGLIYYYFEDKQAIHDAVLLDGGERIKSVAERAYASTGSSFDRLTKFVTDFRQLHVDRPHIARVAMRAEVEDRFLPGTSAKEQIDVVFEYLTKVIEEGIDRGEFRPVNISKLTHSILGLVHSLTVMALMGEAHSETAEDVAFVMDLLRYGVMRQA